MTPSASPYFAPARKLAAPEQVARRSFTVAHKPQPWWSLRSGTDWTLRKYGQGACTVADGEPNYFSSETAAYQAGGLWNATGRSVAT